MSVVAQHCSLCNKPALFPEFVVVERPSYRR